MCSKIGNHFTLKIYTITGCCSTTKLRMTLVGLKSNRENTAEITLGQVKIHKEDTVINL